MPIEPDHPISSGPLYVPGILILDGSVQVFQPADDHPLGGIIPWSLSPGMFDVVLEISDSRSYDPILDPYVQRTLVGLGKSGPSPGITGQNGYAVHCGPLVVAGTSYTRYVVTIGTKLTWADSTGSEHEQTSPWTVMFSVAPDQYHSETIRAAN